jgi:hypothetical protein
MSENILENGGDTAMNNQVNSKTAAAGEKAKEGDQSSRAKKEMKTDVSRVGIYGSII